MTSQNGSWQRGDARQIYAILAEMTAQGEPGAVATVIRTSRSAPRHSGSKMIVRADGSVTGSVGGGAVEVRVVEAARQVIADGQCQRLHLSLDGEVGICGGETEVFIEPVSDTVPFWVIGAGHIGRALVEVGAALPFRFTVVDDRAEFLADLSPAGTLLVPPAQLPDSLQPVSRMVILIASRNHDLDGDYLEAVFAAEEAAGHEVGYLGVIGSRTKAGVMARRFADSAQRRERYGRVVIPAGLSIGAETPPEIAVSILAEILSYVRGAVWLPDAQGRPAGVYYQRTRPARRATEPGARAATSNPAGHDRQGQAG